MIDKEKILKEVELRPGAGNGEVYENSRLFPVIMKLLGEIEFLQEQVSLLAYESLQKEREK